MGVLLTAAAIVVSVAVGVWAERRRPRGGRARRAADRCVLMLYVLIPPVIFFNLAAAEIDVDHGVGLVLGLVAVVARRAARLVGGEPGAAA